MDTSKKPDAAILPGRVASVDFFRGLTMFLLAGEATRFYSNLLKVDNGFVQAVATQFHHHEWHGLHFLLKNKSCICYLFL